MGSDQLKSRIVELAREAGFDEVRVTSPDRIGVAGERLKSFLADGFHGEMAWMADHVNRRADPAILWPEVRSIIMLGMNYGSASDPLDILEERSKGAISIYAWGKDYHDIIKKKLKVVAGALHRVVGAEVKVFVDTAPVMEKPLAASSGIGWQGKHTNLVSRSFGSWLFLGAIFTTAEIVCDEAEEDHCGSCRKCLDICPTDAFPAPYRLDARRCISYLTIEYKGHIAREFREPMGNRIYGCDDCLAVCPWNKWARVAGELRFFAREGTDGPSLSTLLELDDAKFRQWFSGSPVKRTGRDRFIRNVLIAAGNSGDAELIAPVKRLMEDASPLVRAMAVWALSKLVGDAQFLAERGRYEPREKDEAVLVEWRLGGQV